MPTYSKGMTVETELFNGRSGIVVGYTPLFQADAEPALTFIKGQVASISGVNNISLCFGPTNGNLNVDRTIRYTGVGGAVTKTLYDTGLGSITMPVVSGQEFVANTDFMQFGYDSEYGLYIPPGFYAFLYVAATGGPNLLRYELVKTTLASG